MTADRPILSDAVAAAPISGKSPLAIAAPHCTLIMEIITAGMGGIFNLIFIQLGNEARSYIFLRVEIA